MRCGRFRIQVTEAFSCIRQAESNPILIRLLFTYAEYPPQFGLEVCFSGTGPRTGLRHAGRLKLNALTGHLVRFRLEILASRVCQDLSVPRDPNKVVKVPKTDAQDKPYAAGFERLKRHGP